MPLHDVLTAKDSFSPFEFSRHGDDRRPKKNAAAYAI